MLICFMQEKFGYIQQHNGARTVSYVMYLKGCNGEALLCVIWGKGVWVSVT